jgi:F-type H+-transporting ATPase subunit gamma
MASNQNINRHINTVEDTVKICKAMEMIATVKMRRAQDQAIVGRPYVEKIGQVISDLATQRQLQSGRFPLLNKREVKKISIVHITTDRGLCGDLNDKLNHLVSNFILQQTIPVSLITVGQKGKAFMHRIEQDIHAEFSGIGNHLSLLDSHPIAHIVIDDYTRAQVDLVYLAYVHFINTSVQQPVIEKLLPVEPPELPFGNGNEEYIWEPDAATVLGGLLPRYIEMRVYHAILELIASEQSARMVAMRNASDNATKMIQDLTLVMNRTRQETITDEICDITRLT